MKSTEFRLKALPFAIMLAFGISPNIYADDESTPTAKTAPIVVTGTRTEQNSFDLPIAIDVVSEKDIQDGQLGMTLSESLIRTPGITAQSRTQMAQDPQISSRGFGSRSSFGVRGIRVYVDGIPLTMPDGQGQPGVVDLSAVKSIEVMRGPFSALYGNSSGGVIQMFTEDAPKTPEVGATAMFGSYDTRRQVIDAAGSLDGIDYLLNVSNFDSNGYRDHSGSDKQQATAKFKINLSQDTKITTLINWFDQDAQDPLGLDRARAFSTPKAVVPAVNFADTRVSRTHTQIGFNFEHAFDESNKLTITPYVGTRKNAQVLTTTALATTLAGTSARLSEIDREFYGTDGRFDHSGNLGEMPYTISAGLTYGRMVDARKDTNILQSGAPPVPSNVLNRDEDNIAKNFDEYLQGKLGITNNLDLHAGLRHTHVTLEVDDHFISGANSNGNNSGSVNYQKTTPVVGAVWKVSPMFNVYANYGKGFETPTFIEAAYNSTGTNAVPNLSLKPSQSRNLEIGTKAFLGDNTQINFNVFRINTEGELIISTSSGGRTVYTNANNTRRTGAEFSVDSTFAHDISTYLSYSLLNAKFDSDFGSIKSGNKIPGTYRSQLYGEVAWKYPSLGFNVALEGRYNSKVYVNDTNTDNAPSYTVFNLRTGFEQNINHWDLKEYVRVENLFDKQYIGSVRVNDSNSLFFEPGAERNYLLGLSANYHF